MHESRGVAECSGRGLDLSWTDFSLKAFAAVGWCSDYFISVFTIPTPSLGGFSVCDVDEFAVGDAGGLEGREFSATCVSAHFATMRSESSGHGFWVCSGVDIAVRSMLDALELVCVNALGEVNRRVATAHKLLGNGGKLWLDMEKGPGFLVDFVR